MVKTNKRTAELKRDTKESSIFDKLDLDGNGDSKIDTQIGMLTHMLEQIAKHGSIDLTVTAKGDIETGPHHLIEDTAIVLGRCLDMSLGERIGITRMSDCKVVLDEALTEVVMDLGGRGYHDISILPSNQIGEFPTDLARHFFESLAVESKMSLHISVLKGKNEHHIIEATFKAFSRALKAAIKIDDSYSVPSTKGVIG